jgi:hypothetical protein
VQSLDRDANREYEISKENRIYVRGEVADGNQSREAGANGSGITPDESI